MARANDRGRAGPLWLWVLGLLAVLLAVWSILRASRGEAATLVEDDGAAVACWATGRARVGSLLASSRVDDPVDGRDETALCDAVRAAGQARQVLPAPTTDSDPGAVHSRGSGP